MTIQVDIAKQNALAELVAHVRAGEDVVLTSDGQAIAVARPSEPQRVRKRTPGAWAHLGQLQDPDLFLRPDPDMEQAADGPIFPET
ncbi:MAG: hypothetical protein B7Z44_13510 [Caulobacter sp. 12-67-6]|nr:MAG: hypothetical protein B7Z44_13510 [Caulobacter sp. 12-67-6]OYX70818.1 MAG: hypothetical protein B7Y81_10810 [Caulobacter sp. 32-67-35]OZA84497.1 MAG: hypothetical protein B7X77_00415 [Caulobacter sp. 39-67-4]HQR91381.1 hypothetical protein [Caulobacter sp.]